MIKHGYIEELVCLMESIITDKTVIKSIISSNLFKNSSYILVEGKLETIQVIKDKELPKGFNWLIISVVDQSNVKYEIKYMYYSQKQHRYKTEIEQNIKNKIMIVAEYREDQYYLCCILKNADNI